TTSRFLYRESAGGQGSSQHSAKGRLVIDDQCIEPVCSHSSGGLVIYTFIEAPSVPRSDRAFRTLSPPTAGQEGKPYLDAWRAPSPDPGSRRGRARSFAP